MLGGPRWTYRYLGEDIEKNCEDGEVDPDPLTSKPGPQVLRHGENAGSHIDWDKDPA